MTPSILNLDFSDRTGVGSHTIIWPTIGLATVAQQSWPYQAPITELWNLQFHICAFNAHVFFALPMTGMDQLSQRDQMQVMQALNEMQMQESTGFSVGAVSPVQTSGDDEYLQQSCREVLQRMCHKFSHEGREFTDVSMVYVLITGNRSWGDCHIGSEFHYFVQRCLDVFEQIR